MADDKTEGSVAEAITVGEQVLEVLAFVLNLAQQLILAGKNPVTEIKRIVDADPELAAMQAEWNARINNRFPDG